jgi:hypothetical protein
MKITDIDMAICAGLAINILTCMIGKPRMVALVCLPFLGILLGVFITIMCSGYVTPRKEEGYEVVSYWYHNIRIIDLFAGVMIFIGSGVTFLRFCKSLGNQTHS